MGERLIFLLAKVATALVIVNVALVAVAFLVYLERKALARFQVRMGPNRAGPAGMLQSFADLIKALRKEMMVPAGADKVIFVLAPLVCTLAALAGLSVIAFGPARNQPGRIELFGQKFDWFLADVNAGVLLILAASSLGVYGVLMAGWGSNSKYPLLSAMRASAQVISYELTLGLSLVGVFLLSGSLSLADISTAQHPNVHPAGTPGIPYIFLQPVGFIAFFVSALAETNRVPFDLSEAEQELVAGYHTEYSGISFLLFQLAEYTSMVVMSALGVICFFGGWVSPFAALLDGTGVPVVSGLLGSGVHWFFIKLALFIFGYYWVRWTLPRFRYDQLMGICWKVLLPLVLGNILLIATARLWVSAAAPATASGPYWWIVAGIEAVLCAGVVWGLSRLSTRSWFGQAERPVLIPGPARSRIRLVTVAPPAAQPTQPTQPHLAMQATDVEGISSSGSIRTPPLPVAETKIGMPNREVAKAGAPGRSKG